MLHAFLRAAGAASVAWLIAVVGVGAAAADAPATPTSAAELETAVSASDPVIQLAAGTYTLDRTLVVSGPMTVAGAGAGRTLIVAPAGLRAFDIAPTGALSLTGVTVTGADDALNGGAIFVSGALMVRDSVVEKNHTTAAGTIATDATECPTLTLSHTLLRSNSATDGGAISFAVAARCASATATRPAAQTADGQSGRLTLDAVTLEGNTANRGGGIMLAGGAALITDSAAIANRADAGGAVFNAGSYAQLLNDTFAGNSARSGGGIDTELGLTRLVNVTLDGNTASIGADASAAAAARLQVLNSILGSAGGTSCGGAFASLGHNVVARHDCGMDSVTDRVGVGAGASAPAANGGPTVTEALRVGSPAVDAGDAAACPGTDQRGVTRPHDEACDAGAFESALDALPSPTPVASGAVEGVIGLPDTGAPAAPAAGDARPLELIVVIAAALLAVLCLRPSNV